ncbi:DUF2306 domain-containing protein [Ephemeroptericola cinctiostellae]|nr:DUF2306 domain-containing protein [Ephemeroptericola cinctiostellae]
MSTRHRTIVAAKYLSLMALLFCCALVLFTVLQHTPVNTGVGFLQIKQDYMQTMPWPIVFYVHIFSSMFALVMGVMQLSKKIRVRHTTMHRWLGRMYVLNVLLVAAPAGLIMSIDANDGFSSRTALTVLPCLWWYFTYTAYWSVIHRDFIGHRNFMVRSFALTLSIITLRLWEMGLMAYVEHPPMDLLYPMIAWLGFMPNLMVAEWWIRRTATSHATVSSVNETKI